MLRCWALASSGKSYTSEADGGTSFRVGTLLGMPGCVARPCLQLLHRAYPAYPAPHLVMFVAAVFSTLAIRVGVT